MSNLLTAALVLLVALAPASSLASDLFIYPKGGQSQEQQQRDRYECNSWAIQNSGFDPANPPTVASGGGPEGGEVVRGGARGAAMGAVIGAIAGDAGKGAAAGAAGGAMMGGFNRRDQQRQQAQAQQQAQAAYEQGRAQYNRAMKTCLEARNYTVN